MLTQKELVKAVDSALDSLKYNIQPNGLYDPIRYVLGLGGKRIRPALMMMAYQLYKDAPLDILPHALALEVYHNFTLMHDDVIDRAEVRRGQPTVHKKWNDNVAILSGDAMLILAYRLMTERRSADNEACETKTDAGWVKALNTFTNATLGVYEGQQYDIDFESRSDVTVAEYMEMIRLKTSLLLSCALKMGAQLAGAPEDDAESLAAFGEKMGLAFQLQDDLLDVYGDPEVFGKAIGGDILCNKKTFMLLTTLSMASPKEKNELQSWIHATHFEPSEKIEAVVKIFDSIGIRTICEQKIEELFGQALSSLENVKVESSQKDELRRFAHELMNRQY
jgi:geranylgeranyl diphosphate synthase type II